MMHAEATIPAPCVPVCMKRFLAQALLIACLLPSARAQFLDPGFEQGGSGAWSTTDPMWTGPMPSDAPFGGDTGMGVRAQSQNFPENPYFYQAQPVAQPGDPVELRFTCRPEVVPGNPPVTANAMVYLVAISGGVPSIIGDYQLTLLMSWTVQGITFTVPALPGGSVFGIGFAGYCAQGQDCMLLYDNIHISIGGSGARLNAKAWLDGCYEPAQGLMRDDLRAAGLIPLTEGNTGVLDSWQHLPGGESTAAAVLAATGPNAIVDWIRLELRMGSPLHSMPVAIRNALIQRDGDIVDTDGASPVTFPVKGGNYYVHVVHRNHLGVLSADVIRLTSAPAAFDARSPGTALYAKTGPESGPRARPWAPRAPSGPAIRCAPSPSARTSCTPAPTTTATPSCWPSGDPRRRTS